jgi:hypothetical protein
VSFKKIVSLLALAFSLVLTGFFRDTVFKSINALLKAWDYDMDYYLPSFLEFTENYEYGTLQNLKWFLTILFSLIYLAIALLTIRLLFSNRSYLRITIGVYIGITIVSGLFMIIGYLFPATAGKMYEFARYFMGMAQSPVILMVLIPAFKLSEKKIHNSGSN